MDKSLFDASRSALPPGPGLLGRQGLGAVLIATGLSLAGLVGAGLWKSHGQRAGCRTSCSRMQGEAARKVTWADRQRLMIRVAEAESAAERGAGCRLGLIRLKLELNSVETELAECARWQAELRHQRAALLTERARILAHIHGAE